jgi:homoserine dehydrogenase
VGPLAFYGQGAGSLPTGNAMVQDVLDYQAGRRPTYDFSRGLTWDPTLLAGSYLFRTTVPAPDGATAYAEDAPGVWRVDDITPTEARALFEGLLAHDPASFMAQLPQED